MNRTNIIIFFNIKLKLLLLLFDKIKLFKMISLRLIFYCAWFSILAQIINSYYPVDLVATTANNQDHNTDNDIDNENYFNDEPDIDSHSMPETVDFIPVNNGNGVIFFRNKHQTTLPPMIYRNGPINTWPYLLNTNFLKNYKTIKNFNKVDQNSINDNIDWLDDYMDNQLYPRFVRIRRSLEQPSTVNIQVNNQTSSAKINTKSNDKSL